MWKSSGLLRHSHPAKTQLLSDVRYGAAVVHWTKERKVDCKAWPHRKLIGLLSSKKDQLTPYKCFILFICLSVSYESDVFCVMCCRLTSGKLRWPQTGKRRNLEPDGFACRFSFHIMKHYDIHTPLYHSVYLRQHVNNNKTKAVWTYKHLIGSYIFFQNVLLSKCHLFSMPKGTALDCSDLICVYYKWKAWDSVIVL